MNLKKKIIILVSVCLVILVGAFIIDRIFSKNYFQEIKYEEIIEKINDKDSFVVMISQTTCNHCMNFKPKLEDAANDHKLTIYYIDVDLLKESEADELKSYINYDSTPSTIFIKKGVESSALTRINGDASREKIDNKLKSNGFID